MDCGSDIGGRRGSSANHRDQTSEPEAPRQRGCRALGRGLPRAMPPIVRER